MQYELSRIENIILKLLDDKDKQDANILQPLIAQMKQERTQAEQKLLSVLFCNYSEAMRRRYIRYHQMHLLDITGRLHQYMLIHERRLMANDTWPLYDEALSETCHLLKTVELRFAEDIRMDIPAAYFTQQEIINELRAAVPFIDDGLELLKPDIHLCRLITNSFEFLLNADSESLTYGQLYMMRDIGKMIIHEAGRTKHRKYPLDITKQLIENLCRLNFNRLVFYKFCRNWVIQKMPAGKDAIYSYSRAGKFFARLKPVAGYAWNHEREPVSTMLRDNMHDLVKFKKREWKEQFFLNGNGNGRDTRKIVTTLTISQLGLIIRLFIETGIFRIKSMRELTQFMARNVVTVGKNPGDEFSDEHLKNSISKSAPDVIDKVEQILNDMLSALRKIKLANRKSIRSHNTPS